MNNENILRNKLLKIRELSKKAIDEIDELESNSFNKEDSKNDESTFKTYKRILDIQIPCYETVLNNTFNLMYELNEFDLIVSLHESKSYAEMDLFYTSEELENLKNKV